MTRSQVPWLYSVFTYTNNQQMVISINQYVYTARNTKEHPTEVASLWGVRFEYYFSSSKTAFCSSFICSTGKGGSAMGFIAMDISFTGLSSAAIRFELSFPQRRHRCIIAYSPFLRTHTPMASMIPPQSEALYPGSSSTCMLDRQLGQWFLCSVPAP